MTQRSVDELRAQLRSLGYLSRGIERWFALDPWSSRTFWAELLLITFKAAAITAPFAAIPLMTVMLIRNRPVALYDALLLLLMYLLTGFGAAAALVLATAALFKIRPIVAIERPGSVLWASLLESALLAVLIVGWWVSFPAAAGPIELVAVAAGLTLLLVIGAVAFSAALLSFSIHETQQIPSIHKRPLTVPLTAAGAALLAAVVVAAPAARTEGRSPEPAVVVAPTGARVALVAVDGLTRELLEARPTAMRLLPNVGVIAPASGSAPEIWATVGTGTPADLHGVRAVQAVRITGSERLLQSVSSADAVLTDLAPVVGLTRLQPLPPTARERHYVWEVLASRGVASAAVNWWTSSDVREPNLRAISQESVFSAASATGISPLGLALAIDRVALDLLETTSGDGVRFTTVYLPALDIVLNRLALRESVRVASSVRALDQIESAIQRLVERRWTVLLVGSDVIASTEPIATNASAGDLAPTILDLFGFPASEEMPGQSLIKGSRQGRVKTFGSRRLRQDSAVDDDYYENLRALGYIR